MYLAWIPVADRLILPLAGRLRDAGLDATAEKPETGYDREVKILALTIDGREALLRTLRGRGARVRRTARHAPERARVAGPRRAQLGRL